MRITGRDAVIEYLLRFGCPTEEDDIFLETLWFGLVEFDIHTEEFHPTERGVRARPELEALETM
jgi:hypothetical protein